MREMPDVKAGARFAARRATVAACGALLSIACSAAFAQGAAAYPGKTIRIVVPFPPGGSTDIMVRALAPRLSDAWKQAVLVENRPGAGGMIGADAVARSPADGYTYLAATISHAVNVSLYPKAPYQLKDLQAVAIMGRLPLVPVVRASSSIYTLQDLVAASREKNLSGGSSGNGGAAHLALELFNAATGARIEHVPYKGGAQAMTDLLGGQIDVIFALLPEALPHLRAGKLRALAVTTDRRHPLLPDTPTALEAGFRGIEITSWNALMVPAGTPRDVVTKANAEIVRIVSTQDMRARIADLGYQPVALGLTETEEFVRSEVERWANVVRAANIKPD